MAVTNPKKTNLTSYRGNSFSFLYEFLDEAGADIDLATDYTDIQFRVFKSGSKDSPEIDLTVDDGLTIGNTNELSGAITAAETEALPQTLFYEILFTLSDGTKEVYLFGRFFVENYQSASGEATAEFTITIDQTTNTVTFSESYDATAKAVAAKVDAETAKTAAETAQTATETAQTETLGALASIDQVTVDNAGYYVNQLLLCLKIGEPVPVVEISEDDVVAPPTGIRYLFYNTDTNSLSIMDSSGTATPI